MKEKNNFFAVCPTKFLHKNVGHCKILWGRKLLCLPADLNAHEICGNTSPGKS
jgi:hypothetical protein